MAAEKTAAPRLSELSSRRQESLVDCQPQEEEENEEDDDYDDDDRDAGRQSLLNAATRNNRLAAFTRWLIRLHAIPSHSIYSLER